MADGVYAKLFPELLDSSVFSYDYATRIVWVAMLALKDDDGRVLNTIPGLARRANVAVNEVQQALKIFSEPDPYSRTPDNEGRRIEPIFGGWIVLNHHIYREMSPVERRKAKTRDRVKRWRDRNACNENSVTERYESVTPSVLCPLSSEEEESRARDPGGTDTDQDERTYQDEVRLLEQARREQARKRDSGPRERIIRPCPECPHPLKLFHGRYGPFLAHPRGTALGCTYRADLEDYELAVQQAEQRKSAADAPPPGMCSRCHKVAAPRGGICHVCQQRDMEREMERES